VTCRFLVGVGRFELPASSSRTRRKRERGATLPATDCLRGQSHPSRAMGWAAHWNGRYGRCVRHFHLTVLECRFGDIALDQMMARPRSVIGIG
jgi:hypothetical protein